MTIANMRNGVLDVLVSSGKWTRSEISGCDFGVAVNSACAVILQPGPDSRITPLDFGTFGSAACGARDKRREWRISGILLIKDRGNPELMLGDLWQGVDDLYTALSVDDSLNGMACVATLETISRPTMDSFIEAGGIDYGFLTFSLVAEEW